MTFENEEDGFRAAEISFLQEQNLAVLRALEDVEKERDDGISIVREWEDKEVVIKAEFENSKRKIEHILSELEIENRELCTKDEHVRVLSQQNQQMLELLEKEEAKGKDTRESNLKIEQDNEKLRIIENDYESAKLDLENRISVCKTQVIDLNEELRMQRARNDQLRNDLTALQAQTQVEIEALEQSLKVVHAKNLDYLGTLQKQEIRENQHQNDLNILKENVNNTRQEVDDLKREVDGEDEEKKKFEKDKGTLQNKIESTEAQISALKSALATCERVNENLQEENRQSAERYRDMADKVYGLMDQLRVNQMETKKNEVENNAKQKKLNSLDKQIQNLQAKITMEVDAKTLAEEQRREAEQEANVLKKTNRKIEENIGLSQKTQEKCEASIKELTDKITALQTQNSYLQSRIDGQEEEKSGLKAELKKASDRLTDMTRSNTDLRNDIEKMEDDNKVGNKDKNLLKAELEYIKREDVLDQNGRQRPILIQSSESNLLEKLQINEYLYEAQQNRNPVPSVVEKIAHLLEMLHTAQSSCDQYLSDLSRSNGLVSALRQKNMVLFEKTQMFDSFKTRALVRYVMNMFESGQSQSLHLDGLNFNNREIQEMLLLMQKYNVLDKVFFISLAGNAIEDESVHLLLQLIMTVPYLRALDLRNNEISPAGLRRFEDQLKLIEGVTGVTRTANRALHAHSGNQLRLAVELNDQSTMAAHHVDPTKGAAIPGMNQTSADTFLGSHAGLLLDKDKLDAKPLDQNPQCLPPMKRVGAPAPPMTQQRIPPNHKTGMSGKVPGRPESANSGDSAGKRSQRSGGSDKKRASGSRRLSKR